MAKFNIDVLIDPAGAVRGAARVRRELDGTNDSVDRLRRNVGMLGAALGALGAGALFIQAIQSASRFGEPWPKCPPWWTRRSLIWVA